MYAHVVVHAAYLFALNPALSCVWLGGFIYRGTYLADALYGAYVFGDNQNK